MDTDLHFLSQEAEVMAKQLLGWRFYHRVNNKLVGGIVVETEAYNQSDAASHSYRGQTPRTEAMFGPAGHIYVYFTYGMHYCVNIVTGSVGSGQAVLLRSLIPDSGLDFMRALRLQPDTALTNGPAKICQALAISAEHNGSKIDQDSFVLIPPSNAVIIDRPSKRIGINRNTEALWRFTGRLQ